MQTIQIPTLTIDDIREVIREEMATIQPAERQPARLRYYSRKEVAEIYDTSLVTVDKWCKSGYLKRHRIGGKIRFKADEVDKALSEVKSLKYKR